MKNWHKKAADLLSAACEFHKYIPAASASCPLNFALPSFVYHIVYDEAL